MKRASSREIGRAFAIAVPAIALPFIIRAAVVQGVATATEVSTIGIGGARGGLLGGGRGQAWGLTQSGFSRSLSEAMRAMPGGAASFMAVSVLAFIVLGSVLEGIPAIVLFGPLLFPIAKAVGVHEVHYAMVVILAKGLGLFAPPFGVGYYAACAIGRVSPDEGIRPITGYMIALFIGLVIVAAVPWISIGFL